MTLIFACLLMMTMYRVRVCSQENANKPDNLPPSQGGKYVGFGSTPAPQPRAGAGNAAGIEDVTQMLSKGLTSLTQVCPLHIPLHGISAAPTWVRRHHTVHSRAA